MPRRRGSAGSSPSGERGFSLVEVIFASLILAVALSALAATAIPSVRGIDVARGRQAATAASTRVLETVRQQPYDQVAMAGFAAGTVDVDGAGPIGEETLVIDPAGVVDNSLPFHGTTTDGTTLVTYVTLWCLDASADCDAIGDEDGRRVTVVASWRTGNGQHETSTGTLIARIDRD